MSKNKTKFAMTESEAKERNILLNLQKDYTRWFTQEEFDRLTELNRKLLNSTNPMSMNKTKFAMTGKQIESVVAKVPVEIRQDFYQMIKYLSSFGCQVDTLEVPDPLTGFNGNCTTFWTDKDVQYEIHNNELYNCWSGSLTFETLLDRSELSD